MNTYYYEITESPRKSEKRQFEAENDAHAVYLAAKSAPHNLMVVYAENDDGTMRIVFEVTEKELHF